MNFASAKKKRPRVTEINLTPLIDIVFQLLIFFLITTSFVQNPGIDVDLPKSSSDSVLDDKNSVTIAITAEGRIIHDGVAVSLDELKEKLRARHKQRADAVVIIQADATTNHGKVVEVMDAARAAGFADLAIATDKQ